MFFVFVFGVDKDIIKIHYHENVEFLYQNLINVALKCGQCVDQSKRHHLILKIAIAALESRLPFIFFLDPYLMIGIGQIKLN